MIKLLTLHHNIYMELQFNKFKRLCKCVKGFKQACRKILKIQQACRKILKKPIEVSYKIKINNEINNNNNNNNNSNSNNSNDTNLIKYFYRF